MKWGCDLHSPMEAAVEEGKTSLVGQRSKYPMHSDELASSSAVAIPTILIAGLAATERGAVVMMEPSRAYLNAPMNSTVIVNSKLCYDDILCEMNDEYMKYKYYYNYSTLTLKMNECVELVNRVMNPYAVRVSNRTENDVSPIFHVDDMFVTTSSELYIDSTDEYKNVIEIVKAHVKEDLFTKPLRRESFMKLRNLLLNLSN